MREVHILRFGRRNIVGLMQILCQNSVVKVRPRASMYVDPMVNRSFDRLIQPGQGDLNLRRPDKVLR
jgi:hypothetical protein